MARPEHRTVVDGALADGKILPVERAVIGAVLLEGAVRIPPLVPEEFWLDRCRLTWQTIKELEAEGIDVDVLTVTHRLTERGELETVGGPAFLAQCMEEASILVHLPTYAELVRSAARERMKRALGLELQREGLSDDEIIARLAELPGPLAAPLFDPAVNWRSIVASWERGHIATTFRDLDTLTGGLTAGDFIVVGGRTSHGKTSWMTQLALSLAIAGTTVSYVTLEESSDAIVQRLVSNLTGISNRRLKDGTLSRPEFQEAERAVQRLQGLPLTVTGLEHIRTLEENDVVASISASTAPVVVVDHLQQITTRDQSRVYGLERVLKRLQSLALRDRKILLLGAQLNRETEARQGPPRLSDLRDCGAIEQAARLVLLLYWPNKHDEKRDPTDYELYVSKQSLGGTGLVQLRFEPWCGRFTEVEHPRPETRRS
jgi:replicative DNA helicase